MKKATAIMIENARLLASSDGENVEYDRALVELTCHATGNSELLMLNTRDEADMFVLGRLVPDNA